MQPEPGQVGDRGHPHHLLESVLQGPLAHPRRLAQVGHVQTFGGVRQGVIFGDLHDPAVSLPRQVVEAQTRRGRPIRGSPAGFRGVRSGRRSAFAARRTPRAVWRLRRPGVVPSRTVRGRRRDSAAATRRRWEGGIRLPDAGPEGVPGCRRAAGGRKRSRIHPPRQTPPRLPTCSPTTRSGPTGSPFSVPAARGPKATNATKPSCNLVRVRTGRLVDWNNRTLAPRRTTTRRTRRGLDSSCTASCSITSMVSPTAVGSLISTTVTADEGLGVTGLVDSGEIFMVCGISIDGGPRQLGYSPNLHLLARRRQTGSHEHAEPTGELPQLWRPCWRSGHLSV